MENLTIWTLIASVALPLVPQVISIALLRRIWRSGRGHYIALTASGMVQVMSGLWLLRSFMKLPLFFDAPLSAAYQEWATVTLESGPYMATTLSLLAGWFWVVLAWSQRNRAAKADNVSPAAATTLQNSLGAYAEEENTPSVFVKSKAKQRRDNRRS